MTTDERPVVPLPMFPLGSVLFPTMVLPLHVFEPRYRVLMHDCMRQQHEFGVVLIERGTEVGGGDTRFDIGTVARIREAVELPDGRWAVLAVGTRRMRVHKWLPDDPYPLALVEDIPAPPLPPDASGALAAAEGAVRRALALAGELEESPVPATFALDPDPATAAWQLAANAPLGPVDHQRLLSIDDPQERLELLAGLAAEASAVLAYRLGAD